MAFMLQCLSFFRIKILEPIPSAIIVNPGGIYTVNLSTRHKLLLKKFGVDLLCIVKIYADRYSPFVTASYNIVRRDNSAMCSFVVTTQIFKNINNDPNTSFACALTGHECLQCRLQAHLRTNRHILNITLERDGPLNLVECLRLIHLDN